MNQDRRKFLQLAGSAALGSMIIPQWACQSGTQQSSGETAVGTSPAVNPSLSAFALQLYTLRDVLPADPKGVLQEVAGMGYPQIEGYEGKEGMFWGMGHKPFKAYMDQLGMKMIASHCSIKENFAEKAAQAAEIGMEYLICPWVGPQESLDDFKKIADEFNECGKICQENGIRFAYHNHDYSFKAIDGVMPQDLMMENTDPATVDYELDLYWVVTGGADPIAWLKKYPNRFRLCHVKDRLKGAKAGDGDASCVLGTGSINYPEILKVASDNGMQHYILEQERYDNSTPLESAKAGAEYLKNLVFA